MSDQPGPDVPPAQPPAGGTPPQQPPVGYPAPQPPFGYAPPAQPAKNNKKWIAVAGGIGAVAVAGLVAFTVTGSGDAKAGDCVDMTGEADFDVVDCDADEAEAKIAGIDDQGLTSKEFDEAPVEDVCTDFRTTEYAIWIGDIFTEPGTIYCLESL